LDPRETSLDHCDGTNAHGQIHSPIELRRPPATVGVKEVDHGIWLVSFVDYDLGHIDLEE